MGFIGILIMICILGNGTKIALMAMVSLFLKTVIGLKASSVMDNY